MSTLQQDVAEALRGGWLRLYADPRGTPVAYLAELRFGDPAFGPTGVAGEYRALPLAPEHEAPGDGVAVWFCTFRADGTTPITAGTVGLPGSGAALTLNTIRIRPGAVVRIDGWTLRET